MFTISEAIIQDHNYIKKCYEEIFNSKDHVEQ